jgi:radical SAM-linked protein
VAKPVPPRPASAASASPAVQRLVVRYAKRGKMRFASHRDVARAVERGVRRAGLPIAYSAGFTPHPKISYAGGAPTGVASEAEYLTLALTSEQDPSKVGEQLNAMLPDGIEVIDVTQEAAGADGAPEASMWRILLPGVPVDAAERAVAGFLAQAEAPVERLTDKGVRRLDARSAVVEILVLPGLYSGPRADAAGDRRAAVTSGEECAILRMVVLHTAPAVRPDDVLTALSAGYGITPSIPPLITRVSQGQPRELTVLAAP